VPTPARSAAARSASICAVLPPRAQTWWSLNLRYYWSEILFKLGIYLTEFHFSHVCVYIYIYIYIRQY
jgi:hypothetical protein